jgi:hypothetical protein
MAAAAAESGEIGHSPFRRDHGDRRTGEVETAAATQASGASGEGQNKVGRFCCEEDCTGCECCWRCEGWRLRWARPFDRYSCCCCSSHISCCCSCGDAPSARASGLFSQFSGGSIPSAPVAPSTSSIPPETSSVTGVITLGESRKCPPAGFDSSSRALAASASWSSGWSLSKSFRVSHWGSIVRST